MLVLCYSSSEGRCTRPKGRRGIKMNKTLDKWFRAAAEVVGLAVFALGAVFLLLPLFCVQALAVQAVLSESLGLGLVIFSAVILRYARGIR